MAKSNASVITFNQLGLSNLMLNAVHDLGYDRPTPVQTQAIPQILAGHDVMAAAQTGTGKTAAFLLPALDGLGHYGKGDQRGCGPLMLVVTPTRELAQQIEETARVICKHTHHSCTVVVGGVSYDPQRKALEQGCDLLIATPGRLIDLMDQGAVDLHQVQVLVLDEADRMLDMGFLPSMRKIVARTPTHRQTLLFSATLDDHVLTNTKSLVHNPAHIEIARRGTAAQTIDQFVLGVSPQAKVNVLIQILKREGSKRVIVFCRGKHRADMICRKLRKVSIEAAPIHGNRSQSQRESALRRFTNGEVDVLVATDVLARGIDIADVAYVVNLDVPADAEDYIHRIGRTGRAGEHGWALTLVTEDEYLDLRDIEQLMGKVIPAYPHAKQIDVGDDAFEPDPKRNPHDKLPGKRVRKQLQALREREKTKAKVEGEISTTTKQKPSTLSLDSNKVAQPARGMKPERAQQPQPKGAGNKKSAAHSVPRTRSIQSAPQQRSTGRGRYGSVKRLQANQIDQPSSTPTPAKPRRHPGDHGGANAQQR